jgi:hypothetical protein
MRVLKTAGLRGVEKVIRAAAVPELVAETGRHVAGLRRWLARPAGMAAELGIGVYTSRNFQYASVTWVALPAEPKGKRALEQHRVQEAFFKRYSDAAERAYRTPPRRISAADRRILLAGEFQADVNNGGFDQYLSNKGRRRAAETLRVLEDVGSDKMAAMLRAALANANDEKALQKLSDRFFRCTEDLPGLMMRDERREDSS